jgi:hypothetical protein
MRDRSEYWCTLKRASLWTPVPVLSQLVARWPFRFVLYLNDDGSSAYAFTRHMTPDSLPPPEPRGLGVTAPAGMLLAKSQYTDKALLTQT